MLQWPSNTIPKGRFAPSPTGRMHLGNIVCALVSWLSVKSVGGKWVLRIEDLDEGRCRREYADSLMSDLEFLGLEWDEGPYWQSERHNLYQEALEVLTGRGVTYPCWCTRAVLNASSAPHQGDGRLIYPGTCRDNPQAAAANGGKPASVRIRVDSSGEDSRIVFNDLHYGEQSVDLARECGDFVLRRADGAWAYQLAVVVDDAMMGITQVVRGRDLMLSAAQQTFLYNLLGCRPPQFAHIPLICNQDGLRLCKRDRAMDIAALRSAMSSEEIIGLAASLVGLCPRWEMSDPDSRPGSRFATSPRELVEAFDWRKIPCGDVAVSESDYLWA